MLNDQHARRRSAPPTIGLIAGWGEYPHVVAKALKTSGHRVVCQGIKGHADPSLAQLCDDYCEIGLAQLGRAIRNFRRRQVTLATMAGKIHKVVLFRHFHWICHLPDWRCVKTFAPHYLTMTKDRKDDTLLMAVIDAFAEDGITFAPATDFAPELLVKTGVIHGRLTDAQRKDVEFGWTLAKELGRLDVGQCVVVKGQAALAVEAIEGTDECIRRAALLCPSGGFTVVKTAKPQQDMRFDVPTIGLGTLGAIAESGGRVLAVEAGKTILLNEPEVARFAKRHKITVVAIDAPSEASANRAA